MNPATTARQRLVLLLPEWHALLQDWSASGRLSSAARQALVLQDDPPALTDLVTPWSAGDFTASPPIVLLPGAGMNEAMGAYAISTGTIYLNRNWLVKASKDQVLAVLTEELGHHLDGLLNRVDTPGDEGESFAALLVEPADPSGARQEALRHQDDHALLLLADAAAPPLAVELAESTTPYQLLSTPIPAASPARTRQEWQNLYAFAALRSDGSVVTWGASAYGGKSSGVDFDGPANNLTVSQIFSTSGAFAALRSDGSVVTWRAPDYGGNSSGVDFNGPRNNLTVSQIFSTAFAFAALRSDGSVVSWGDSRSGGDSSGVDFDGPDNNLTVSQIFSTSGAFAALRSDGSVVTWGNSYNGGDSSGVDFDGPANNLTVSEIFSNPYAFAALRSNGSVVSWGEYYNGGNSSAVTEALNDSSNKVTQIFSTSDAFAALRSDGSVITWGDYYNGGDSSGVDFDGPSNNLTVTQIFSTNTAFAALRSDGSVVSWGDSRSGGDSSGVDFDGPDNNLTVSQIFSNENAFAALRSDGSVVSWGDSRKGGDSSGVDFDGPDNNLTVSQIFSTLGAFAALRSDGSVVTWGDSNRGGDSSGVDFNGPGDNLKVVSLANPITDDRLVFLPSITLKVAKASVREDGSTERIYTFSPASVTEDGTAKLIYTFSRTGATTAALSVNYTVAGTATLGSDYTGISTTGTTKTVTFAAGSTGVTVTVDPRAESTVEDDETVELTLAPGDGYTIGTTAAVIGTISNDDATDINSMSILGSFNGNSSAAALAGRLKTIDSSTNQGTSVNGDSSIKALAQLTAATPLKTTAKSLLDRYVIHDPDSGTKRKASADDAGFLDFTLKTGSLKSLTAEIQLASEVKATAYVKVNPNTGDAYDFTYDPVTGLGAELLDTNKNGLVDTLRIHLQDGAKGDADGLVNGEIRDPGVLAEAPRAPVYRFYRNGVHFYTTSDTERDNVIKNSYASGIAYADLSTNPQSKDPITGGWGYRFEGVAYQALETQGTALYRFFSPSKGYHFVTTNTTEALNVIKNSVGSSYDLTNAQGQQLLDNGWGYQFEGNTYKVSSIAQTGMDQPVYRFFNGIKGVHFYSSSMAEAKSVIANSLGDQYATDSWVTSTADALKQNPLTSTPAPLATGWGYSFEGIAWYV